MRSSKLRLEEVASPENLREAFLRAARGKAHKGDVIAWRADLDGRLEALRRSILAGSPPVGRFTAFTIWEPKERRIHAPSFGERVLHHALVGPCEADFERWLVDESFACRRGRGREAALGWAEARARRHRWFLKLDVAKYFDSVPHEGLLCEIARRFRDRRVVALWSHILASYSTAPGRGLPIGALTSQHLANFYLVPLDRLVKQDLRLPGYARYMDDMALWADDQETLLRAKARVEAWLASAGLRLNRKWHLQPVAHGMDFLGYRVRPGGSTLARASRRRFVRRSLGVDRAVATGSLDEATAQRRVLALAAFVQPARRERVRSLLFSGHGHRAPTASTAAAAGGTPPTTAAPPTATGTPRTTAGTTSASASPSAHAPDPDGSKD